ncbi:MAG: type IV pilus secretin PilQ [Terriglobia bacterium]
MPQSSPVVESHVETAPVAPVKPDVTVAKVQPQTVAMLQENRTPLAAAPPVPTAEPAPAVVTAPASPAPQSPLPVAGQVISAPAPAVAPKYSGDLISLELKDADLKDFFRLIGEISGLNIVLDPDVKGSLTIFLNDVPWDQALDVVLKNNNLGKQLDGNVLRIAANTTLEQEETQRKRLSDARVVAAELQTETRILSYAKAADMSAIIKKVLSPRGDIIVDVRTNSMIITDIPQTFTRIDNLIRQLDRKIKQVEIEARVVATTRDFLRDIGVQLGAIYGNGDKNVVSGAVPGNPFSRQPPPSVTMSPGQSGGAQNALPLLSNLGANAATSGVAFFAGITDKFLLDSIITAAERRGSAKLLSKPKIITQDNIEGFVQQGVKIPVQTTINNTVSVQFFDFSLKLTVTPQITDEGTIIMKVDIENSTPDFSRQVQGVPTVNTQQTKTTVLVSNGGTVVVGGVMIDNEQTNVRQVPGFGSLPAIGYLFKNKSVNKQTQELIFFLSPKIL